MISFRNSKLGGSFHTPKAKKARKERFLGGGITAVVAMGFAALTPSY
jgi:hypothetical protein